MAACMAGMAMGSKERYMLLGGGVLLRAFGAVRNPMLQRDSSLCSQGPDSPSAPLMQCSCRSLAFSCGEGDSIPSNARYGFSSFASFRDGIGLVR